VREQKGIDKEEKKAGEIMCEKCLKPIKIGERYSFIGTYDRKEENSNDKIVSEYYYHLNCWTEYLKEQVNAKVVEMSNQFSTMLGKSPIFQNLKNMMGGISNEN
jgi:hypothetical protein